MQKARLSHWHLHLVHAVSLFCGLRSSWLIDIIYIADFSYLLCSDCVSLIFDEHSDGLWRHIRHYFHSIILFLKQASQCPLRRKRLPRSVAKHMRSNSIWFYWHKKTFHTEKTWELWCRVRFSVNNVLNLVLFLTQSYRMDLEDGI